MRDKDTSYLLVHSMLEPYGCFRPQNSEPVTPAEKDAFDGNHLILLISNKGSINSFAHI